MSATPLATAATIVIGVALVGYFFVVVGQLVTLAAALGLVGDAVRAGAALLSLPGDLLFFGGLLGGAITVPMWMYRSSRNLRALGATGLRWSPGLSAGGWFIPVANLVVPFFALDELERSSRGQRDSPFVWVSWASMLQAWLFAALLIVVLIATEKPLAFVQKLWMTGTSCGNTRKNWTKSKSCSPTLTTSSIERILIRAGMRSRA